MIYVVILNWNGWQDTLPCLQSLFETKGADFRVVVCDNGSTDGSVEKIESWLNGNLEVAVPEHPRLAKLLQSSAANREDTTRTQYSKTTLADLNQDIARDKLAPAEARLTLIENEANLGFAGGNNSGIRYAMNQADMTHLWLLNNDTLVEPDCLLRMLRRSESEKDPSICGSRVMFYDDPSIVQALGGNKYNRWTGNASPSLGRFMPESAHRDPSEIEKQMDYVSGCSMLIPRDFLDEVGPMEESYFLYYEEIDWFVRGRGAYKPIYADDAVLYHKEGSAIGSASLNSLPSALSEFYCFRNKLRFTRRHFPLGLPICYVMTFLQVMNRCRRGYWASGWRILKVLLGQQKFAA